jgi:hypothetical protein
MILYNQYGCLYPGLKGDVHPRYTINTVVFQQFLLNFIVFFIKRNNHYREHVIYITFTMTVIDHTLNS